MTRLWIGFSLAVACVATYPFDFRWDTSDGAAMLRFLDSCCHEVRRDDVLLSMAAFIPFGYLGMRSGMQSGSLSSARSAEGRRRLLGRLCFVVLSGTAFALALQAAQIFLPAQSADLQNVGWSFAAVLGAAVLTALMQRHGGSGGARLAPEEEDESEAAPLGEVAIPVNLRQFQADYLDRLAEEMAVSSSEACRRIVSAMLAASGTAEDAALEAAAAETQQAARRPSPAAGRAWTSCAITLDQPSLTLVERAAGQHNESVSRTLRHVIAAFMQDHHRQVGEAPPPGSGPRKRRAHPGHRRRQLASGLRAFAALALIGVPAGGIAWLLAASTVQTPVIVSGAPWAGQSAYILLDHHSHTKFSDGALDVAELGALARNAGCNVLAITDNSDAKTTLSAAQFDAFKDIRRRYPGLLLFGGVEVNMPSYGQREHATVLVPPDIEEAVLPALRDAAESNGSKRHDDSVEPQLDRDFLALARDYLERGDKLVMIYNHPSRKDRTADENFKDITRWNASAPLFIGFAGAPGHQNAKEPGNYEKPLLTKDRWDPVVADVGGTWDSLLSEGYQLWGAIAGSDYHDNELDNIPCTFSRTHVAAPGFTYEAILEALRAGTFWADHGRLLQELSFSAEIDGLPEPVYPGSVVRLGSDSNLVLVRVALERGPGAEGAQLQFELIGNCRTGKAEVLAEQVLPPGQAAATVAIAAAASGSDRRSCFLRARIRRNLPDEPDLMAYTNPIRILLR